MGSTTDKPITEIVDGIFDKLKLKRPRIGLVTGISGSGRSEGIANAKTLCDDLRASGEDYNQRKKLASFSIGKKMQDQLRTDLPRADVNAILNCEPLALVAARNAATYEIVFRMIDAAIEGYEHLLVDTHSTFDRKGFLRSGHRWLLTDLLQPEFYVTVLESEKKVHEKLQTHDDKNLRDLDYSGIAKWENTEMMITSVIADRYQKPFYVIPATRAGINLMYLMFHPERILTYIAYSMTMSDGEEGARLRQERLVSRFIDEYHRYFPSINPRWTELVGDTIALEGFTVERDEGGYVMYGGRTISLFPKDPRFTAGTVNEQKATEHTTGEHLCVWPDARTSPFQNVYARRIFNSVLELWKYLKEQKINTPIIPINIAKKHYRMVA